MRPALEVAVDYMHGAGRIAKALLKNEAAPRDSLIASMQNVYRFRHKFNAPRADMERALCRLIAEGDVIEADGKVLLKQYTTKKES